MKLNFLLPGLALSGGTKVILRVASGLLDRGHEVRVSSVGDISPEVRSWIDHRLQIRLLPNRPLLRRSLLRVHRRAFGPHLGLDDQIHYMEQLVTPEDTMVATAWPTALAVYRAMARPAIYYTQHLEALIERSGDAQRRALSTYQLPLGVLANSSWLASRLESIRGSRPPTVLPGYDRDVFFPRPDGPDGPIQVLTFCDRRVWKGYSDVLAAFDLVATKYPQVQFVAYGAMPPDQSARVARVRFRARPVGQALAELYQSSHLFVLGSWYESSPLQPLEALACGVPTVTTPFGLEDYAVDGENVVLTKPHDPTSLARAIIETLGNAALLRRLREAGPETVRPFTWEATAQQADQVIHSLVQACVGPPSLDQLLAVPTSRPLPESHPSGDDTAGTLEAIHEHLS